MIRARNDEVYVAHAASMAHARLYRKYGFEVAETYTSPESKEQEAILWVRGWQLKAALRKILNVHVFQARTYRAPWQYLLPSELQ